MHHTELEQKLTIGPSCVILFVFSVQFSSVIVTCPLLQAKSLSQQFEKEGHNKKLLQGDLKATQLQTSQLKNAEKQLSKVRML